MKIFNKYDTLKQEIESLNREVKNMDRNLMHKYNKENLLNQ